MFENLPFLSSSSGSSSHPYSRSHPVKSHIGLLSPPVHDIHRLLSCLFNWLFLSYLILWVGGNPTSRPILDRWRRRRSCYREEEPQTCAGNRETNKSPLAKGFLCLALVLTCVRGCSLKVRSMALEACLYWPWNVARKSERRLSDDHVVLNCFC